MAYGYRRGRSTRRRSTTYGRRRSTRRRRTTRRSSPQKVIIQVIGGPGGYVPISATAGKKGKRVLRRRH